MHRRQILAAACGAAALGLPALPLRAQGYPERPIKLYQGYASGGNADAIARALGTEMGKTLGQPVVVEAQTGAGGTIAATTVARARPDGHTLLLATGGHAVAAAIYQSLPYRSVADFEMVSTVTHFPFLLVVATQSRLAGLRDVIASAKASPGTMAYGTAGVGSTHHLAGELLARMAGVSLLHVPYRGDTASLTALLAGDVPCIIAPPTAVMAHLQSGRLRAIATTGAQRWAGRPSVPTVAEQGVPGYDVRSWAGLMAPSGTPRAVVERLNAEVTRALQTAAVRQRLEDIGGEPRASTPEEMKSMVAHEIEKWQQLVAEAKIPRQ